MIRVKNASTAVIDFAFKGKRLQLGTGEEKPFEDEEALTLLDRYGFLEEVPDTTLDQYAAGVAPSERLLKWKKEERVSADTIEVDGKTYVRQKTVKKPSVMVDRDGVEWVGDGLVSTHGGVKRADKNPFDVDMNK